LELFFDTVFTARRYYRSFEHSHLKNQAQARSIQVKMSFGKGNYCFSKILIN